MTIARELKKKKKEKKKRTAERKREVTAVLLYKWKAVSGLSLLPSTALGDIRWLLIEESVGVWKCLYADLTRRPWRNTPALTSFSATVSFPAAQQHSRVLQNLLVFSTWIVSFTFHYLSICLTLSSRVNYNDSDVHKFIHQSLNESLRRRVRIRATFSSNIRFIGMCWLIQN